MTMQVKESMGMTGMTGMSEGTTWLAVPPRAAAIAPRAGGDPA